jgi:hypothetical protein
MNVKKYFGIKELVCPHVCKREHADMELVGEKNRAPSIIGAKANIFPGKLFLS